MVRTQAEDGFEAAGFLFLIGGDMQQQFSGQQVVPAGHQIFTQQQARIILPFGSDEPGDLAKFVLSGIIRTAYLPSQT
jgi:hypothetical protein